MKIHFFTIISRFFQLFLNVIDGKSVISLHPVRGSKLMRILFALIIIVPAMEIGLLILSGNTLGVWPTLLLIIATGVLGAWLAKKQGLEVIRKAREDMHYGQMPGYAIIDGMCVLVGGTLLLTPGFITDSMGFILLFPATRNTIKPLIGKIIQRMINNGQFTIIRR